MTMLKSISAAAIVAAAVAVTAPASAVITTFASFSPIGTDANFYFKNSGSNGSSGTSASVYTIASASSKVTGSVDVKFSFLQPAISPYVTDVTAKFTLFASLTNTPAQSVGTAPAPVFLVQPGISGGFSFLSTAPITIGSTTYAAGANLLTGVFNQGVVFGQRLATSGSFSSATSSGATITYTSDFLSFVPTVDRDFSISLTSIQAALQALPTNSVPNRALRTFRAVSGGTFSSDPAPTVTAVPEPAVWGLMIVGFGMVGIQSRRRNRNAGVAA